MAFIHGSNTVVLIDGFDIGPWWKKGDYPRDSDIHDMTMHGTMDKQKRPGLRDTTLTLEGGWDNSQSTGPRARLQAPYLSQNTVSVSVRIEGTGPGKPEDQFVGYVKSYKESLPNDEYIMWSAVIERSGSTTYTFQP